ncbi:LytTR family DNA-binding domain-containing protein [Prolixibacteraceae bacterium]|nr:LytTR family DNA-binding domain-containing protein [Prolixibacteraceae bacterium]
MYKGIIVEDEFNAQQALLKMLRLLVPKLEILDIFSSFEESKSFLDNTPVDLVFMDIELEDGVSIEKLKDGDLDKYHIIFTTGYNQYAIDAIKLNALDYILKPIEPMELQKAVNKALTIIDKEKETTEALRAANKVLEKEKKELVVKTIDNTHYLNINNIVMFQSEGAYTRISTDETTILASKHLKYYENIVVPYGFIRTHQSFIVNKDFIQSIQKTQITLVNGMVANISVRKYAEVMEQVNNSRKQ